MKIKNKFYFGLKEKIFLFTMGPFICVLIIMSILTIQNKMRSERKLVLNRIETYVALLESGDLSFASIRDKEKMELLFNEKVVLAELIKRNRNIIYSTGFSKYKIKRELIDKAFCGFIITHTEKDEIPLLVSLYPIIVKATTVGVFHLQLSFEKSNSRIKQYIFFICLLNILGIIISFLLIGFLSRKIILNRLKDLTNLSVEISKGNLDYRLNVKSTDELGMLASTFNDMTGKLAESSHRLEEEKKNVFDKMEELKKEIIQRKQVENELRQTLVYLKHSNNELKEFAYIASHDLQEPLRMISNYVQLLARRYQGKLDADADDFIAYTVSGVKRMHTLINDLLSYSQIRRDYKFLKPTDCEIVLKRALANLQMLIKESGAGISYDALPRVMADSSRLTQLFQNLIENAIKFQDKKLPQIHVSAKKEKNEWVFSVRDNGIGIDPEFFKRIFIIFQRLHFREEYTGTGIGLALCKKIVECHDGRIWVESKQGEGSVFYFTIPIREKK